MSKNRKNEILIDKIYQEILDRIIYRLWDDDHHTHEQEIAEELGANRTHVRQALARLQHDGLVKVIPRHGVQIIPVSHRDIREIYQISTRLELLAVELAAGIPITPQQIKPLESANIDMAKAYAESDIKTWVRADEIFHHGLVTLSGNRMLCEVHKNICGRAQRARIVMLAVASPSSTSPDEHDAVLQAICKGDAALARRKLEQHFERALAFINTLVEPPEQGIL